MQDGGYAESEGTCDLASCSFRVKIYLMPLTGEDSTIRQAFVYDCSRKQPEGAELFIAAGTSALRLKSLVITPE